MPYEAPHFRHIMVNKYHDVIHDYGPGSSDERWENVQKQLLQFDPTRFTIDERTSPERSMMRIGIDQNLTGGVRYRPLSRLNSTAFKKSLSDSYIKNTTFKRSKSRLMKTLAKMPVKKYQHDITDVVLDFVEKVNTEICFNTFNAFAYSNPLFATIFDSNETDSDSVKNKYHGIVELYNRISYYVRLHGYDITSIFTDFMDLTHTLPNNLFDNLNTFIFVSIYDIAGENDSSKKITKTRSIKRGGAGKASDESLKKDELEELIAELEAEKTNLEMNIERIHNAFLNNPIEYAQLRINALNSTKRILRTYKQTKKAGSIDNASQFMSECCFIPPIPRSSRFAKKSLDQFTDDCLLKYYDTALIDYYRGALNEFKAEEEAIRLRAERESIRESSGKLTKSQKMVRGQFCSLIAKLGLVLNGEYAQTGEQILIPKMSGINDTMTAKEVNLLANWANWQWNPDFHETRIYKSDARSNIDLELFNTTHRHFSNYTINTNEHPICRRGDGPSKYIIDNAAIVPNNLKDYVFCPVSSVVDGMKKCNVSKLEEYGNMDFVFCEMEQYMKTADNPDIRSISHYYNGRSIYNHNTSTTEYVIEIKTPYIGNEPITLNKVIPLAGTALEAHNVLRETLVKVIDFMIYLQNNDYQVISSLIYNNSDGIFGGLYDHLFNSNYDEYPRLNGQLPTLKKQFLNVILNILFKGSGDLFQEINAVCKWGGYSSIDTYASEDVISYNSENVKSDGNGNTLRMLIANDQPSGCRFAFLLLNGHPDFINEHAFGGYMGTGKSLIVTRKSLTDDFKHRICTPNQPYTRKINVSNGKKTMRR